MRGYSYWLRWDFDKAKEWAKRGVDLKSSAHLDTKHDCSHTLALAQRDSGDIDAALKYFLDGETIEAVVDPAKLEEGRGGHYYGNIGRCLQFKGDYTNALICLGKSARNSNLLMNSGWAASGLGSYWRRSKTSNWPTLHFAGQE